jgi:hypothetical protein
MIFTFECCILLRIYLTGSLWHRRSQQSFNTLTLFYFPFSLTTCFGPYGPSSGDICISNIDNTPDTKKRQAITGIRQKSLHSPQLDHYDAGHKTWRTTQTTMRRYKCAIRESVHSSGYFNILYMGPLLYTTSNVEFGWFYNFYFYIQFNR